MMKRFLGLILALCLILGIAAEAAAAGKPVFSQQPKSATTDRKGTVSFSVKVKANGSKVSYTWYFINPATGEKVSGKNLSKTVKGVKVAKPNTPKITLKKVPAEMHGWLVYCHINGNGYKQDSDQVVLNVYGMEPVSDPSAQPEGSGEPAAEPEQPAEGAETAEPAEGGETAEPAPEGGETAEPAEEGETAEPTEGGETAEAEDGKHRHQRRNPHRKQVLHHRGNRHAEDVLQIREDGRKRQPCENDHGAEEAYAIPLSRARCEDGPAEYGQIAPGQQARCDD